jgi:hypothetical protein
MTAWIEARSAAVLGKPVPPETPASADTLLGWNHYQTWCPSKAILLLSGPAGAGKSAISHTLAESYGTRNLLAASFFFSRGNGPRGILRYFLTTIAHQLAMAKREWFDSIGRVVAKNPNIINQSLDQQLQKLIVEPLQSTTIRRVMNGESFIPPQPFLVVIDGLDECKNDDDHSVLLRYITEVVHTHRLPFTFLIASRPDPHIHHEFEKHPTLSMISNFLFLRESYDDVAIFLHHGFHQIRENYHKSTGVVVDPTWPSNNDVKHLVERSSGYFVYASIVLGTAGTQTCFPGK